MLSKNKSYETVPTCDSSFVQERKILTTKGPFFGKRHWLILALTLLTETTHSVKVYMTVCIVAMTDPEANSNKDVPNKYPKSIFIVVSDDTDWCWENFGYKKNVYIPGKYNQTSPELDIAIMASCNHSIIDYGTFGQWGALFARGETVFYDTYNWKNKGIILSSFLWGLCLSQMFAGWLVSKYKAKWPIVFMVSLCSIVGFLIPTVAATLGSVGVIICRIIQGGTMGSLGPFIFYLYGKWIPPCERGKVAGIVSSGGIMGVVISMYLSGLLAATPYGWPLVIYFYSGLCLIWCIIFGFICSDTPAEHSTISIEEQLYIEQSLSSQAERKDLAPPYRKMFSSIYVWANIISRLGGYFGYFTILSEISTYLKDILDTDIKDNGLLSAIPYFCTIFFMYFFGILSDLFITKKVFSRTKTRKIMAFLGCIAPGIFLILLAHCESGEKVKIITCLVLIVSLDVAGTLHSTVINSLDLAPNHAGTIEGIINQISQVTASGGPLLVQFVVSGKRSAADWKIIFYIVAAVKALTVLVFLTFGTAEVQPWNEEICKNDTDPES